MEKLNQIMFEEIVDTEGEACLVLFSRESCHVCKGLKVLLAELEQEYAELPFYTVDVEQERELFSRFGLKGVPQTLFFRDGEQVARISGEAEEQAFLDQIEALLN